MSGESKLSVAAIAISIVAVCLTGYQSWLSYQHNRVSLSPKLDWRFDYNRSGEFIFQIRLINAGLGPAIISDASLTIDDEPLGRLSMANCSRVDELLKLEAIYHTKNDCWDMEVGEEIYLNPNEELILYQIGPHAEGDEKWVAVSTAQRLGVVANYCSFYGDCGVLR